MPSQTQLVIDKWPRWAGVFFLLFGFVLTLIATITATHGNFSAAMVMLLLSLLAASLYLLENRTMIDAEKNEIFSRFRWTFWRSDRRIPFATVAQVYLRPFGKGGREVGVKLADGSDVFLGQAAGLERAQEQRFARQIAERIGVPFVELPRSDAPLTKGQLVVMNVICHAFAASCGFIAWVAATRPDTDGTMAWPAVWICGGVAALILTSCWYSTIREILSRRKG